MRTEIRSGVRRTAAAKVTKFVGVGERQVRVIASDSTPDRMGDVLDPAGVDLKNYRRNPVVLWQHDVSKPIAKCASIGLEGNAVVALIEFPQEGVSDLADECLRLMKAGIVQAVSVGFIPLTWEPIKGAGLRFTSWEMLELSCVSVPANPSDIVTEKSMRRDQSGAGSDQETAEKMGRIRRAADLARHTAGAALRPAVEESPDAYLSPEDLKKKVEFLRKRWSIRRKDPRAMVAEANFRLGRI